MINQVNLKYKKKNYMTLTPMIFAMIDDGLNKNEVQQYLKKIGIEQSLIKHYVDINFKRSKERII